MLINDYKNIRYYRVAKRCMPRMLEVIGGGQANSKNKPTLQPCLWEVHRWSSLRQCQKKTCAILNDRGGYLFISESIKKNSVIGLTLK